MRRPYIGVTGFTTRAQTEHAAKVFGAHPTHLLGVGVLVMNNAIHGRPVKSRWTKRMPPVEDLKGIFPLAPNVLNAIHYCAEEEHHGDLAEDLLMLDEKVGLMFDAFQLNVFLPDPVELQGCKRLFIKDRRIILQITDAVFKEAGGRFSGLFHLLKKYEGAVTDLLWDGSRGTGTALDPELCHDFLEAAEKADIPFTCGIAGGLGPSTLTLALPLMKKYRRTSIDAESGVFDEEGNFSIPHMTQYLDRASMAVRAR